MSHLPPADRDHEEYKPADWRFYLSIGLLLLGIVAVIVWNGQQSASFTTPTIQIGERTVTTSWITNRQPGTLMHVPIEIRHDQVALVYVMSAHNNQTTLLRLYTDPKGPINPYIMLQGSRPEKETVWVSFQIPWSAQTGDRLTIVVVPMVDHEFRTSNASSYEFGVQNRRRPTAVGRRLRLIQLI